MIINLEKYAKLIVNYCTRIKKGDKVLIWGNTASVPLAREVFRLCAQKDAHPYVKIDFEDQDYLRIKNSSKEALKYVDPFMIYAVENIDAAIIFRTSVNTREMSNVDPEKLRISGMANNQMNTTFLGRAATGEIRYVVAPYPTIGYAQEANMSVDEFSNLITKVCFLNKPDPAAEWQKLREEQQKYVDYLNKSKEIRILSKGTDLKMNIEGRKWMNGAGRENLPDGEVFTGPIEDSANGYITFSYPAIFNGKEIRGIKLVFKNGKVIEATAEKGEEILLDKLKIPGANQIGEIAIGTNWAHQNFVNQIMFDEKIGGTVHLALGRGYPQTGSKAMSSLHWDILCDMHDEGKIYVDETLIYENGQFLI